MKKRTENKTVLVVLAAVLGILPFVARVTESPESFLSPQSQFAAGMKTDPPFVYRGRHIFLDETARFVRIGPHMRKVYAAHTISPYEHESVSVRYFARSGDLLIEITPHERPESDDPYFQKIYLAYSETLAREFYVAPFAEDLWLIERAGKGEMGIVYKAWDAEKKKFVAVKLRSRYRPEQIIRFAREARQLLEFNHPNVVKVLGLDETDAAYFVMEYLEGETFWDFKERHPNVSLHQILEMGIQAADGLQYIHDRGIVHRDIKPDNLMWADDGSGKKRAVIIDFGLLLHADQSRITPYGNPVGSPVYMAPEQVLGRDDNAELDARADIYSLGAVLFSMIAGQASHKGTTSEVFVQKLDPRRGLHRKNLAEIKPDLPEEIVKIVHRAMAQDPGDRFQSARELGDALLQARQHLPPEPENDRDLDETAAFPIGLFDAAL